MKKILSVALILSMLFALCSAMYVPANGTSSDPADSYVPLVASGEDSDIQLWWQHANVKVHQEDTTSSGLNTYSIYMAKNEKQGANLVLYSPTVTKEPLKPIYTDFVSMEDGTTTVDAQLYYEFYVDITNTDTTNVLGVENEEDSIIRNGLTPEGLGPVEYINYSPANEDDDYIGAFTLTAGKTQTFLMRAETTLDTPSGWYKANVSFQNTKTGAVVKTSDVFVYVWNFAIPVASNFQTAIYVSDNTAKYNEYYEYLLDNRMNAMCIPGEINSDNPYLTDERVSAFKVAHKGSYAGTMTNDEIATAYADLSTMENWDEIKEKAYFYTKDEPTSQEQRDAGAGSCTVAEVISDYNRISKVWEDPYTVVPFHENHPYPYKAYSTEIAANGDGTYTTKFDGRATLLPISDGTQGMMDADAVTIWCPKTNAFTPQSVLDAAGYAANNEHQAKVRNLNGIVSGFNIFSTASNYFDWDSRFGSFESRIKTYIANKAAEGKTIKMWWYGCGMNSDYTYCNHLIENSGLQTQLLFWQGMQVGATGYLYYGADLYTETGSVFVPGTGKTYDGAVTTSTTKHPWLVNKGTKNGYNYYGNGVLFYNSMIRGRLGLYKDNGNVVHSLRVELMRDGLEDYEMLYQYRDAYGEDAMQSLIEKVSSNVACYISLPGFTRDASYSSDMSDEDVFAAVRIELGNAVEAAQNGPVKHTVTCDGVVVGEYEEGETVELPVPAVTNPTKGKYNRFFTWTGNVTVTRSKIASANTTANGRKYTITMPAEDVVLTSSTVLIGDGDGNKRLASADILALRKHLSGIKITDEKKLEAIDVDCNGRIAATDTTKCKQLVAGNFIPTK